MGVMVTVEVAVLLPMMVSDVGLIEIVKSCTVNATVAVCESEPLEAKIVTV